MDTSKIAYFIQHPNHISAEDVTSIQAIKNKFPYCSTLHMLYMKALANSNSVDFESQLKKSAIHVNDREKLHDLINSKAEQKELNKVSKQDLESEKTKVSPIKKTENKSLNTEPLLKEKSAETKVEQKEIQKTTPSKEEPLEQKEGVDMAKIIEDIRLKVEAARLNKGIKPKISEDKTEEISTQIIQQKEEAKAPIVVTEKNNTIDLQQKKIETEENLDTNKEVEIKTDATNKIKPTVETSKTIKDKEIKPTTTIEEDSLKIDVLSHAMETAFELDVDNIIRDTVSEETHIKNENIEDEVSEKSPDELSFTEWLKYKQGKLKLKPVVENQEKEKIKLSKTEIDNLLNKFIEEEPKMSRPQKEFFNPVKNAKKSLDESSVLVSETLAKIYWMQKNYDKAIKAYEQLSLRNPEKKSFFANQIKKIKQELNKI